MIAFGKQNLDIVVVHSYHKGFVWSEKVEQGFLSKLSNEYDVTVAKKFYLNAKLNPSGVPKESESILNQLGDIKYNLLFTTDDEAFASIGKKVLNNGKLVVFAGMNKSLSDYGISDLNKNYFNLSGVLEKYEILPLFRLISDIFPSSRRIKILSDDSETAKGVIGNLNNELKGRNKHYGLIVENPVSSNKASEWRRIIMNLKKDDILVILPFSNIKGTNADKLNNSKEISEWIVKMNKNPEFATSSLTMDFGFFAAIGIDAFEHGEDAALSFIFSQNESQRDLRITEKNYARLNFNANRAKDLGVVIPFELLSYSHALVRNRK